VAVEKRPLVAFLAGMVVSRLECRALCKPAETFTFGGVFAHIMTFNAHRRLMALDALHQLGVQTEGFGDPMEYEESVATWNQRVALKTP
jgi:AraC family transcriptional regulator